MENEKYVYVLPRSLTISIETRGGIPVGKHRVEVNAFRKTGRQVLGAGGVMVDEKAAIGPKEYSSPRSPLIKEVLADSDGRIDIEILGQ